LRRCTGTHGDDRESEGERAVMVSEQYGSVLYCSRG
jgi:hypothetical protein